MLGLYEEHIHLRTNEHQDAIRYRTSGVREIQAIFSNRKDVHDHPIVIWDVLEDGILGLAVLDRKRD